MSRRRREDFTCERNVFAHTGHAGRRRTRARVGSVGKAMPEPWNELLDRLTAKLGAHPHWIAQDPAMASTALRLEAEREVATPTGFLAMLSCLVQQMSPAEECEMLRCVGADQQYDPSDWPRTVDFIQRVARRVTRGG